MRWMFAGYFSAVYLVIASWLLWSTWAKGNWAATLAFCGAVVPLLLIGVITESYLAVSPATRDSIARGLQGNRFSRTYAVAVGACAGILGVLSAVLVAVGVYQWSAPVWIAFAGVPVVIGLMPLAGTWWLATRGR